MIHKEARETLRKFFRLQQTKEDAIMGMDTTQVLI